MEKTEKPKRKYKLTRKAINKKIGEGVTKKDEDTIKRIEEILSIDGTVEDACLYAGINPATYYRWLEKDEKLRDRMERARLKPILLAKRTAVSRLGDSYQNSMDFLSRKRKNEYSQRTETVNTDMTIDEFAKRFEVGDGPSVEVKVNVKTKHSGTSE